MMNETSGEQREQAELLLDISVFAYDLLDPDKLSVAISSRHLPLEVPGALVTMIQYARVGNARLREFFYAYLLKMRGDKRIEESSLGKFDVIGKVQREIEERQKLKQQATLAVEQLVRDYAPFIEGALGSPPGHPSEEFATSETPPPNERSEFTPNEEHTALESSYPIQRYESIISLEPEKLSVLRQLYSKELNLPAHPLLDLYFLQVYHAQLTGIAASPAIPRLLISLGRSTQRIISQFVSQIAHRPRGREFLRRVQDADAVLEEFVVEYVKSNWQATAFYQVVGLAISYLYSSGGEVVPTLLAFGGELVLGAIAKAPGLATFHQLLLAAIVIFFMLAAAQLCGNVTQFFQEKSLTSVPAPFPTIVTREPSPTAPLPLETATPLPVDTPVSSNILPRPVKSVQVSSVSAWTPEADFCLYVVQPGDTLQDIATHFGVSEYSMCLANKLSSYGHIYVHQTLVVGVPCCRAIGGQGISHVVQRRETLYSLARHYGTTERDIAWANRIYDLNYIQEGQMLCIPLAKER